MFHYSCIFYRAAAFFMAISFSVSYCYKSESSRWTSSIHLRVEEGNL